MDDFIGSIALQPLEVPDEEEAFRRSLRFRRHGDQPQLDGDAEDLADFTQGV